MKLNKILISSFAILFAINFAFSHKTGTTFKTFEVKVEKGLELSVYDSPASTEYFPKIKESFKSPKIIEKLDNRKIDSDNTTATLEVTSEVNDPIQVKNSIKENQEALAKNGILIPAQPASSKEYEPTPAKTVTNEPASSEAFPSNNLEPLPNQSGRVTASK